MKVIGLQENHGEFLNRLNWLNTILSDTDVPSDPLTKVLNPDIEDPQGTLIVAQLLEILFSYGIRLFVVFLQQLNPDRTWGEMNPNFANISYDFNVFQRLGTPVGLIPSGFLSKIYAILTYRMHATCPVECHNFFLTLIIFA